jgi:hypothetical protein
VVTLATTAPDRSVILVTQHFVSSWPTLSSSSQLGRSFVTAERFSIQPEPFAGHCQWQWPNLRGPAGYRMTGVYPDGALPWRATRSLGFFGG